VEGYLSVARWLSVITVQCVSTFAHAVYEASVAVYLASTLAPISAVCQTVYYSLCSALNPLKPTVAIWVQL